MEGKRLTRVEGLNIMQEKCTQISANHGTNEGSGTVGCQADYMRNEAWK